MSVSAVHDKKDLLPLRRGTEPESAADAAAPGCPFHRVLGRAPRPRAPEPNRLDLPAPPRPRMSRLRQTVRFAQDPFGLLRDARAECGDLFVIDIFGLGPVLYICSAELLREVYRHDEDTVVAGEIRRDLLGKVGSPRASVAIDGDEYRRRRRVTTPYFTGRRVDRWAPVLRRLTEGEIDRWRRDDIVALQGPIDRIARRTVCHVLYGSVDAATLERLETLSERYLEAFQWPAVQMPPLQRHLGPWSPWSRFVRRRRAYERALHPIIRARLGQDLGEPVDLLSALVAAYGDELAAAATRDETVAMIADELIAFIVGGAETTSKAVAWTVAGLLGHDRALERLRAELDAVVGDRPIEPADVRERLPYLDAVIHEGLRYQSLAPFAGPRMTKKPILLGGFRIDPGTVMVQCLSEAGQSDLFPHCDGFEPDNFYRRGIKPNDWVPFGGGKRICAGMGLALMELAMIVGTLAQRADLELLGSGRDLRPIKAGIAYQPRDGLRVRFRGRR